MATAPPTFEEIPKLHQELGIWMANVRYKMDNTDRVHLWKVQNTSMVVATGFGLASYFLMKRYRPSIKFPMDTVPPFVTFYLTHRLSDSAQMPGLYDSFLRSESPLGARTRDILQAIRTKGRLPSDDYGLKLPLPGRGVSPVPVQRDGSGEAVEPQFADKATEEVTWGPGGVSRAPSPEAPDPWAEAPAISGGSVADEIGWGAPSDDGGKRKPIRRSWDEIRAQAAGADGARQE